jgi:glutamine synthetase
MRSDLSRKGRGGTEHAANGYSHIKNAEIERFQAEVSDWEQREYFEMF